MLMLILMIIFIILRSRLDAYTPLPSVAEVKTWLQTILAKLLEKEQLRVQPAREPLSWYTNLMNSSAVLKQPAMRAEDNLRSLHCPCRMAQVLARQ